MKLRVFIWLTFLLSLHSFLRLHLTYPYHFSRWNRASWDWVPFDSRCGIEVISILRFFNRAWPIFFVFLPIVFIIHDPIIFFFLTIFRFGYNISLRWAYILWIAIIDLHFIVFLLWPIILKVVRFKEIYLLCHRARRLDVLTCSCLRNETFWLLDMLIIITILVS